MPDPDQPASTPAPAPASAQPAGWSQRGIGSHRQHRFFYWLIRLGGKTRGYHMAYIVTFWYVLFYPSIRRRCRFYLDRRFPGSRGYRGVLRRFLNTHRLVRTYGTTLVDMMAWGVLGPASLQAASPDHQRLAELAGGAGGGRGAGGAGGQRGLVLLHAHVGCWQVGMSTLGHLGKRVSLVMIPEPRTSALFDQRDASVIDPRTGLAGVMQMTEALLRGDIVAMMGDRTFGDEQNTVAVQFLGGPVAFPVTPYRLASATGSPVAVLTAPKADSRSYQLRLTKVIEVPPGLGRNAQAYAPYAQQFADCLAEFVQEFPWQFYNFYDLWADGGADSVER